MPDVRAMTCINTSARWEPAAKESVHPLVSVRSFDRAWTLELRLVLPNLLRTDAKERGDFRWRKNLK
jgi:hypothetical protein